MLLTRPTRPANDNLIDTTIRVWQPRLRRDLSREEARQIIKDITGFFDVLSEWAEASTPANDNRKACPRRGPP
jgi:hypothetical protein